MTPFAKYKGIIMNVTMKVATMLVLWTLVGSVQAMDRQKLSPDSTIKFAKQTVVESSHCTLIDNKVYGGWPRRKVIATFISNDRLTIGPEISQQINNWCIDAPSKMPKE